MKPAELVIEVYHVRDPIEHGAVAGPDLEVDQAEVAVVEAYRFAPNVESIGPSWRADEEHLLRRLYRWDGEGRRPVGTRSIGPGDVVILRYQDRVSAWTFGWLGWSPIDLNPPVREAS
jgi:hypothetical protein